VLQSIFFVVDGHNIHPSMLSLCMRDRKGIQPQQFAHDPPLSLSVSGVAMQNADDGYARHRNFCFCSLVHSMFLIYFAGGTTICGSRVWEFEGIGLVYVVESCEIVFLRALPILLFRHFCCGMYHLATVHFFTDRRTDRQTTVSCQ